MLFQSWSWLSERSFAFRSNCQWLSFKFYLSGTSNSFKCFSKPSGRKNEDENIHLNAISMVEPLSKGLSTTKQHEISHRTNALNINATRRHHSYSYFYFAQIRLYNIFSFVAYLKLMAVEKSKKNCLSVRFFLCLIFTILFHMNLKLYFIFWMNFMTSSICNILFEWLNLKWTKIRHTTFVLHFSSIPFPIIPNKYSVFVLFGLHKIISMLIKL